MCRETVLGAGSAKHLWYKHHWRPTSHCLSDDHPLRTNLSCVTATEILLRSEKRAFVPKSSKKILFSIRQSSLCGLVRIKVSVGFLNENDNFSSTYLYLLILEYSLVTSKMQFWEKNPPDFVISHQSSSFHLVTCHIKDWLQIIIHLVHT